MGHVTGLQDSAGEKGKCFMGNRHRYHAFQNSNCWINDTAEERGFIIPNLEDCEKVVYVGYKVAIGQNGWANAR